MNILVSACLLSALCRYDGQGESNLDVVKLMECYTLISVCPKQTSDMITPHPPPERRRAQVVSRGNEDVTVYCEKGAERALKLVRLYHYEYAILEGRGLLCGKGHTYDGTFTGTLVLGDGVTAMLLTEHGVKVIGESRISQVSGNDKEGDNDELEEK